MKKVIISVAICLLLCGCNKEENTKSVDLDTINNFNYDDIKELDLPIHSQEYMIVRMSDLNVLYAKDNDKRIYPASLTKLMTADVVLNLVDDLNETSSYSYEQYNQLINDDASIARIDIGKPYTIKDLLYALILPSGADAAVALENYFTAHDMNLIDEMKKQLIKLECNDTNFVNTTGLHDDNHYTTLNDLFKILMDILSFKEGRELLETMAYKLEDNKMMLSSLRFIKDDCALPLGGKTGYTLESGQSVIVLYKANNRSYIMMLANAMGDPYEKEEFWHFDDAMEIMDKLY